MSSDERIFWKDIGKNWTFFELKMKNEELKMKMENYKFVLRSFCHCERNERKISERKRRNFERVQ